VKARTGTSGLAAVTATATAGWDSPAGKRQFARAVLMEKLYSDRSHTRLRGMINAVLFRNEDQTGDFIEAIGELDGGYQALVDYLSDQQFAVSQVALVGRALECVDQVIGRLNYGAAGPRGRPRGPADRHADAHAAGRSPRFQSVSGLRQLSYHVVADVEMADLVLQLLSSGNRKE